MNTDTIHELIGDFERAMRAAPDAQARDAARRALAESLGEAIKPDAQARGDVQHNPLAALRDTFVNAIGDAFESATSD